MVMGLSVRLFGLSSASILLPQALMGVGTVALLMATVRRTFGAPASIIAGLVTALTPAAVLMFRYNNPDALLTLLLVGSAYAFIRALEHNSLRWVALAGVLVGLGFEAKLLQAFLILPVFAVVYAIAAPGSIRRRIAGLAVAAVSVTSPPPGGSSGWSSSPPPPVPTSAAAPTTPRSTSSSATTASAASSAGGGGNGGGGGRAAAGSRDARDPPPVQQRAGRADRVVPAAVRDRPGGRAHLPLRAPRTDLARAAFLMWGGWLAVHAIVFSFMSGVIHSYYVVAWPRRSAPWSGAAWSRCGGRAGDPSVGAVLGLALVVSAGVALVLLDRTPSFVPGLGLAVLAVTAVTVPLVALRPPSPGAGCRPRPRRSPSRCSSWGPRHTRSRPRRPPTPAGIPRQGRRPRAPTAAAVVVRGGTAGRTPAARWDSPRRAAPGATPNRGTPAKPGGRAQPPHRDAGHLVANQGSGQRTRGGPSPRPATRSSSDRQGRHGHGRLHGQRQRPDAGAAPGPRLVASNIGSLAPTLGGGGG